MSISWFTVIVEVVNFLILIWLLQRVLYKPIVKAMTAREQNIANRLEAADDKNRRAEAEADRYRAMRQALEDQREQYLAQARVDADTRRDKLLQRTYAELEDMRHNWQLAIEQEKASFLVEIERHIGESAVRIARRVLADIADKPLEAQTVDVFLNRLQTQADHTELARALAYDPVRIETAFDLTDKQQQTIESTLAYLIGYTPELVYETQSIMIAGIRLSTDAYEIAWTLTDHVSDLEEQFIRIIDEALGDELVPVGLEGGARKE